MLGCRASQGPASQLTPRNICGPTGPFLPPVLLGERCGAQRVPGPPPQLAFVPLPRSSAGCGGCRAHRAQPVPAQVLRQKSCGFIYSEKLPYQHSYSAARSSPVWCCVPCAAPLGSPRVAPLGSLPEEAPPGPQHPDTARALSEGSSNTEMHWGLGWQRCCSDTEVTLQKSKV